MKQQRLPIKLKVKYLLIKILLPLLLIMACAAVVFYFVFVASKDQMLAYFPSDSLLYVSMNVDAEVLEDDMFDKLPFHEDLQDEIKSVLKEYLLKSGKRNVAFGLLEIEESIEPLFIINLNTEIDGNHSIFKRLDDYGYKSFKINNTLLNRHLVIVSKAEGVINTVKGVLDGSVKGLSDDVDVSFRLNAYIDSKGSIMLDSSILSKIIPADINNVFQGVIPNNKQLVMQIHSYNPVVIIDGDEISSDDNLIVQNSDEMKYGFKVNTPMSDINTYIEANVSLEDVSSLETTYNSSYTQDIKDLGINYIEYTNITEKDHILSLNTDDPQNIADKASKLLIEYLAVKNIGWQDELLPDGTTIKKYAKNRKGLEFEDKNTDGSIAGMDDSVNDDYYSRKIQEGVVTISKNVNTAQYQNTEIVGCSVAEGYEYVALGSEYVDSLPIVGEMFDFVALITYPHTYPQNILCLQ